MGLKRHIDVESSGLIDSSAMYHIDLSQGSIDIQVNYALISKYVFILIHLGLYMEDFLL